MALVVAIGVGLILLVGIGVYTPWRLGNLLGIARKRWLFAAALVGFFGSFAAIRMIRTFSSTLVDQFYLLSTAFLGFLFYLFIFLLLFEVVGRVIRVPKRAGAVAVLALALLVSGYGIWNAYRFEQKVLEVSIPGLERPVSVAVLADVQMGGHRGKAWLQRSVDAIEALAPDLVLIPGDLADSNAILLADNFAPLRQLTAPAYFVTGNHDKYIDEEKLLDIIRSTGVRVLQNEVVETHGLQLIGLDYMDADENAFDLHPSDGKLTIKGVLPTLPIDADRPSLLMHHSPVGVAYANAAGADLYVAGHTHAGGQVFPATLVACAVFYDYCSGLYGFQDTKVFVSPGIGTFVLPMRVGTQNELTLLRLSGG